MRPIPTVDNWKMQCTSNRRDKRKGQTALSLDRDASTRTPNRPFKSCVIIRRGEEECYVSWNTDMRLTLFHLDSFASGDVETSSGLLTSGDEGLKGAKSLSEASARSTTGAKLRNTVYKSDLREDSAQFICSI